MILGNEKRRSTRFRHDSALELFDDVGREIEGAARLVDISAGGARFASTVTLARGRRIRGRLRLMRTGPLDVVGRIVWTKEGANVSYYGVEFDRITQAAPGGDKIRG